MRNERDENPSATISDPTACATLSGAVVGSLGSGSFGFSSVANRDAVATGIDTLVPDITALKTAVDANNASIDSIIDALQKAHIIA